MIFFEKFEGRLPVEQQPPDRRMFRQQGVEIVRLFVGNGAVKASCPQAKLQAVPQTQPVGQQTGFLFLKVGKFRPLMI